MKLSDSDRLLAKVEKHDGDCPCSREAKRREREILGIPARFPGRCHPRYAEPGQNRREDAA